LFVGDMVVEIVRVMRKINRQRLKAALSSSNNELHDAYNSAESTSNTSSFSSDMDVVNECADER